MQADDVALFDLDAVVFAVADGIGDHRRLDMLGGFVHPGGIFVRIQLFLERDGRGNAHRDVLGGNHVDFLFAELRGLVRRKDHVAVVRQDENAFGRHLVHGAQQVVDRGIHGLSAFNDLVDIQVLEELGEAAAQGDRHKPVALFRRGGLGILRLVRVFPFRLRIVFRLPCPLHFEQVVDLDFGNLGQLDAVFQRGAGVVRVHVDFGAREVAVHADIVADPVQAAAEGIQVVLVAVLAETAQREVDAVGVGQVPAHIVAVFVRGREVAFHAGFRQVDVLPAEHGGISLVNQHQAAAAAVNDARLLQGGKHLRRLLEDRLAALEDDAEKLVVIFGILRRLLDGVFGHDAGDGQDRALLGLHDGFVGHLGTLLERLGKLDGRDLFHVLQCLREAAEQLARDDAGIAPGALQRAFGQGVGRFVGPQELLAVDLAAGALHRQGHVRPGIAVRDGKYVQRIDRFPVLFKERRSGDDHVAQQKTVNRFELYQRNTPPSFMYSVGRKSDPDSFHGNADFADLDARHALQLVPDGFNNGFADFGNGNAVFHNDVQVHVEHVADVADLDAFGKVFPSEPFNDAVRGLLAAHRDDAVAFQRGVADDLHHDVFGNIDGSEIVLNLALHQITPPAFPDEKGFISLYRKNPVLSSCKIT